MDDIRQTAIDRFRAYLERRVLGAPSRVIPLLVLFFAEDPCPVGSLREVDQFVERQHHHGRAWATINRRLNALKHFFAFCLEQQLVRGNPSSPVTLSGVGTPCPKPSPASRSNGSLPRSPIRWTARCFS